MSPRTYVGILLGCSVLALAGCGNRSDAAKIKPPDTTATSGVQSVTLHVDGMVERLKLF